MVELTGRGRIGPMMAALAIALVSIALAANVIAAALFYADKRRARLRQRRIPERMLLASALFGPVGAIAAMHTFRHKTRNPLFSIGTVCILGVHVLLIAVFFLRDG
jgi:uncharacterized membrane protein YsdA (DUF1294 family)